MSFTGVAFRVIFANVRFTPVKHRLVRSSDDIHILLGYFCMHVSMDLGSILGRILGRIWDDFTSNVGFLKVEKTNNSYIKKSSKNYPKKLQTWRRRRATRRPFSELFRAWVTLGSQHGAKTCPKRLLGLSWDDFETV